MAKRGTTLIRWTGPSHMQRIIGEWVWRSGDVQEVPDQFALELLTLPTDAFEAVDEADVKRLLAPTLPSPEVQGREPESTRDEAGGKDDYRDERPVRFEKPDRSEDQKKELEDGDDIR